MLFEHLIYSTAIAIIAGMLYYKRMGRDPSWIIIASAYAPDLDMIAGEVFKKLDMNILINGAPIKHGDFHNLAFLLVFAVLVALVLKAARMRFAESFAFAGIGFGAHMFEDALVFNPGYAFLWPVLSQKFGIGIVEYKPDWYGIANTEVLVIGIIAVILAVGIRAAYEGEGGIKRIAKAFGVAAALMILMIPVFGILDINVMEDVNSRINTKVRYIDSWSYTQNASWDSTAFHSGNYSAKLENLRNESIISGVWTSFKIPVKPNTTYVFSAWGKTEYVRKSSPVVRIVELNASMKKINSTALIFSKGTNDWTWNQLKFKSDLNTTKVYVYAYIWKGYGTFWFDDMELYEEGDNVNLIPNGGLEKSAGRDFISGFKI